MKHSFHLRMCPAILLLLSILFESTCAQDAHLTSSGPSSQDSGGTAETSQAPRLLRADHGNVSSLLERFAPEAEQQWETEIRALEHRDRTESHPADSILFIGSSSIRMWDTIAEDVAPFHPIPRGYGGARFSDVAVFAERLIHPHQYRALVLFVANDITGGPEDHTHAEIDLLVRHVIHVAQKHRPAAPVLLVEITPTASRFHVWDQIRQVNAGLRELALTIPGVYFVATAEYYLDEQRQPRPELFLDDQLHQNRRGYRLWGCLIRQRLREVLCCSGPSQIPVPLE